MSDPFLGEISPVGFNFPPRGWAFCNGQILPINQNQALFSLLGTTYGGDGITTFALPNLQGKVIVHTGSGFALGQTAGEQEHTLIFNEMAAHTHPPICSSSAGTKLSPSNTVWAVSSQGETLYQVSGTPNGQMSSTAGLIAPAGGNQPHNNMQPYVVINYVIALQGVFPSRN